MDNFTFYSPTYFVFGKDEENNTGALVKRFGGSKVLLVFGGSSAKKSGLLDRVEASLKAENIGFTELGGIQPNPRSGPVYQGGDLCKAEKIDFILAVGGGSAIDTAKAISAAALYDGDFWDFYSGKAEIKAALPIGVILTIAAAGSEGSADSVITQENGMFKRGKGTDLFRPKFSILNPALTETLPAFQTACGITDIMAHLFERYFTNTKDVETTDRMIEALLLSMVHEGPRVIENPHDYEARANIMWAGMMAHNNCVGVGRAQDWASHQIEHELSALYDCAHGAGLATVFPAWMKYNYRHDVMRFAQVANRVFGISMDYADPERTALLGTEAFENYLRKIGMPVSFNELGAKEEDIPYLAHTCCYGDGRPGTIGGFVKLGEEDVANIYRLMIR